MVTIITPSAINVPFFPLFGASFSVVFLIFKIVASVVEVVEVVEEVVEVVVCLLQSLGDKPRNSRIVWFL